MGGMNYAKVQKVLYEKVILQTIIYSIGIDEKCDQQMDE